MRNLKLNSIDIQQLPFKSDSISCIIKIINNYFVLCNENVYFIKNGSEHLIKENVSTIDWIAAENNLYMGDGKAFHCFNIDTEEIVSIIIPDGFVAHKWNPTQDKIALVNENNVLKIVLLDLHNVHCIIVGEYCLTNIENEVFLNVGWGSQKTQFRGSEGKRQLTDTTIATDEENNEENSVKICWREEGDIFVVSFKRNQTRVFKVFSYDCEFLFENEHKPGLLSEIAWKPDGSLLAVNSYTKSNNSIMFFEKNGLFRFSLKLSTEKTVRSMAWNSSGDILMIWQENCNESEISLWTFTNHKWYLKQSLSFKSENKVNFVSWKQRHLEVLTSKFLINYSWRWQTCINFIDYKDVKMSVVCVIDRNVLHVTLTNKQIVPPPYSSYKIVHNKPITYVTFSRDNSIVVILNDHQVKVYKLSETNAETIISCKLEYHSVPLALNNFIYNNEVKMLYCIENIIENQSNINKYDLHSSENDLKASKYFESTQKIKDLVYISKSLGSEFCIGVCISNQVIICNTNSEKLNRESELLLQENDLMGAGINSIKYINNDFYSFSLHNMNFYYNGKKISNNVTSYLLYHDFLLLTTSESKLLGVKLSKIGLKNLENKNFSNVFTRSIPVGAVLILAVPGTRKIVLQVPRGDIEIINPRILSLEEIVNFISQGKYLEAYVILRKDRINLNVLYDINPTRFLNDAENFILQINNCEYIDIFLSQLANANITEEIYKYCFEEPLPQQDTQNKISLITDKLIEVMKKIDLDYYLQSIVTAYVCKETEKDLENALNLLYEAKNREENGTVLRVPVDKTLEHMIILNPIEKLYDTALGMDNFELIKWIASKSQQDPLKYIPFLGELANMEDNYRHFKINCHLKRYEEAFTFLIKCNVDLQEIEDFIINNSLYNTLVKYLDVDNQWYKPIMKFYCEYLLKEQQYEEAGSIFMNIEMYEQALNSYSEGGFMNEALTAFYKLGGNIVAYSTTLKNLAKRLEIYKQYKNASYIYESIFNNYEDAIETLLKGNFWSDAVLNAVKHKRADIIECNIKPAIINFTRALCDNLKSNENEFTDLKERLTVIRNEKIKNLKEKEEENDSDEQYIDIADNQSLVSTRATSQRTTNTQITSSTSRRKKRIEREILQLKKGSALENIAILRRLHFLIVEMQNYTVDIKEVCSQLYKFNFVQLAVQLQSLYTNFINRIISSLDVIWPVEMINPPNPFTLEARVYRENLEHLDIKYHYPPENIKNKIKLLFA